MLAEREEHCCPTTLNEKEGSKLCIIVMQIAITDALYLTTFSLFVFASTRFAVAHCSEAIILAR